MGPAVVHVRRRGVTRRFRPGGSLLVLRRSVARAFTLTESLPTLVFETASGDRAAVDTDLALTIAAAAPRTAGTIIVAPAGANVLVSVSECIHTVFSAMVDTAARGEVAAAILAMSATTSDDDTPSRPSSPLPNRAPMAISPVTVRPPSPHNRSLRPVSPRSHSPPLTSRPLSPVSTLSKLAAAPSSPQRLDNDSLSPVTAQDISAITAEACFCTHYGIACGQCNIVAIQGTRYRCTSCADVNLCEVCRRSGAHGADRHSYMVYDHPWEASEEYVGHAADAFRAPPAPLVLGDRGPRVMHLHFVLYTLGYLFLFAPGFHVDSFTTATRDAVERFQIDYAAHWDIPVEQSDGSYSARTRASILSRFEDLMRMQTNCRAEAAASAGPRIRSALAA